MEFAIYLSNLTLYRQRAVLYNYFSHTHTYTHTLYSSPSSWATAFNAVPFVCFAFQCHISAVPIYAGLQKRTVKNFFFITIVGILICTIVYSMTGVFGMLTFPGELNSDILRNYCPKDIPVSIARGTLVLCLITSYPILFFCGRWDNHNVLWNEISNTFFIFSMRTYVFI